MAGWALLELPLGRRAAIAFALYIHSYWIPFSEYSVTEVAGVATTGGEMQCQVKVKNSMDLKWTGADCNEGGYHSIGRISVTVVVMPWRKQLGSGGC